MAAKVSCGYYGPKIKSDCLVQYEKTEGNLQIEIETQQDAGVLKASILETSERLEITTGSVLVKDCGAESFVVAARFEAAARQVLGENLSLPEPAGEYVASERTRPRRSRLYVPGNTPRFYEKALKSGADGIILDLEDSVSPSRKFEARVLVAHALKNLDFGLMEIMVRINQGEEAVDDLDWIIPQKVQHILIPKVETSDQVSTVRDIIEKISELCSRPTPVWLMPIIESPSGVFNAESIAKAVPETASLTLGLQDLTAELGVSPTPEGRESFVARSLIVLAARAADLQPIDTVYSDVANQEGLEASVEEAKALGFIGKGCIHPRQVETINRIFLPDEQIIEKAKKIVLAMDRAEKEGLGVVSVGSKMVDPPVARQAEIVIKNAVQFGLLEMDWKDREQEQAT